MRLRELLPEAVALEAAQELAAELSERAKALVPAYTLQGSVCPPGPLQKTPVYRLVHQVATRAVYGLPLDRFMEDVREDLCRWFPAAAVEQAEPRTSLALVVAGAAARERLDTGEPLTAMDLAVLTGQDRDHILALSGRDEIPGAYRSEESGHRPWRYRPNKRLREWLSLYDNQPQTAP